MFKIGDRVLACLNGTGTPKFGTVVGVMTGSAVPEPQYAVNMDNGGISMPCCVLKGA